MCTDEGQGEREDGNDWKFLAKLKQDRSCRKFFCEPVRSALILSFCLQTAVTRIIRLTLRVSFPLMCWTDSWSAQVDGGLTQPQAVQQICDEGTALQFDASTSTYHVIDGEEFVRRFDELRCKRERGEGARTPKRPFSSMCRYYTLLPGPGYAKTGCRFREKEGSTALNQPIANEKAVGDGAPCGYEFVFSHYFRQKARERRAARASACVIGSR
jgi:hypothetical protein